MLEVKTCRQIKKDITKNNAECRKIILDLSKHPFCSVVVSHGDGKSWGYFFEGTDQCFLGRGNQEMTYAIIEYGKYNTRNMATEVIHDNPEVRRVFSEFLKYSFNSHYWYGIQGTLSPALLMNPLLFANLTDCKAFAGRYAWGSPYDRVSNIVWYRDDEKIDYTKPLIKDAFNLSVEWIKVLFERNFGSEKIQEFRKYNYEPKEVMDYCWEMQAVPEFLIPNKEATLKYCRNYTYRDYINMYMQLPDEVRSHYPVNPQHVDKYHDRIVIVYNRLQEQIREKELEATQKAYEETFYKDASKYDYSDKDFSIIACKKLADLGFEGNVLNHCVGSYVNSVSKGREYILFLRKNSDIKTPYFTIDLTPDKRVRQIHGKCNCNMNDDIRPFVEAWAKKFELNLNGCSGVHCALY